MRDEKTIRNRVDVIYQYLVAVIGLIVILFLGALLYGIGKQLLCIVGYNFNYALIVLIGSICWFLYFGFGKKRFRVPNELSHDDILIRVKVTSFLLVIIISLFLFGDYLRLVDNPKCFT